MNSHPAIKGRIHFIVNKIFFAIIEGSFARNKERTILHMKNIFAISRYRFKMKIVQYFLKTKLRAYVYVNTKLF